MMLVGSPVPLLGWEKNQGGVGGGEGGGGGGVEDQNEKYIPLEKKGK